MDEREPVLAEGPAGEIRRESARRTRRSFLVGGGAAAAAAGAAYLVDTSEPMGRLQAGLRRTLGFDAAVDRGVFDFRGLSREFALADAKPLRLNGTIGLADDLVMSSYRLQVAGVANAENSPRFAQDVTAWEYEYKDSGPGDQAAPPDNKSAPGSDGLSKTGQPNAQPPAAGSDLKSAPKVNGLPHISIEERFNQMAQQISGKRRTGSDEAGASKDSLNIGTPGLLLTLRDLKALPHVELVTEFKCIEGWSNVTHWGGVRLRDFLEAYPPAKIKGRDPRYVYMETPDANYYCGFDMGAARHPQSLLVTEMDGEPLKQEHGAPLRLHMPIKYGYKQIKRVGLIAYTDQKPDDYWEKLGYDWYAGL